MRGMVGLEGATKSDGSGEGSRDGTQDLVIQVAPERKIGPEEDLGLGQMSSGIVDGVGAIAMDGLLKS